MARRRKIFVIALGVLAVLASLAIPVSCGGASPNHAHSYHAREARGRLDSATCQSGDVFLGSQPGVIGFSAQCHSQGIVTLDLFRLNARVLDSPGILKFSRHLSVTAPGVNKREGFCDLRQTVLGCRVRIHRPVKVSGRIWVRKGRQCAKRIVLEVIESPRCNKGGCLAVAKARVLASGRPQGC